jgi:hypothetical protein
MAVNRNQPLSRRGERTAANDDCKEKVLSGRFHLPILARMRQVR